MTDYSPVLLVALLTLHSDITANECVGVVVLGRRDSMDNLLFVIIVDDKVGVSLMKEDRSWIELLNDLVGIGFLENLSVTLVDDVISLV